jgi:hypothetical protein
MARARFGFGAIDRGVRGGVDDDVGRHARDQCIDRVEVGEVEASQAVPSASVPPREVTTRSPSGASVPRRRRPSLAVAAEEQHAHFCA